MATAKQLNDSYKKFCENSYELESLLKTVESHVMLKYRDRTDVEDIAQEVLLQVWRSVDKTCENPLAAFDGRASFSTWISLVSHSILLTNIRKEENYESVGLSYDLALVEGKRKNR